MEALFWLIFLTSLPFLFLYGYQQLQGTIRDWQAMAEALGLTYVGRSSGWSLGYLEGTYRGVRVVVDHYTSGQHSPPYTRIRTYLYKRLPQELSIYAKTTLFSDVGKLLGGQDIQVDDPTFDETFIIKGHPEQEVRNLLTAHVRAALLRYHHTARLRVDEACVNHEERGLLRDIDHIRSVLDAQHVVAVALCGEPS